MGIHNGDDRFIGVKRVSVPRERFTRDQFRPTDQFFLRSRNAATCLLETPYGLFGGAFGKFNDKIPYSGERFERFVI